MKNLTVALLGNPNVGKTTLFNQLTGARQRVGNWAGVTVERKEGEFATAEHQVTLVDLPGAYSLTTISAQTSIDEQIACRYILSQQADMVINLIDGANLERNLYLTIQLRELGIPCLVALNMLDIAKQQGINIDLPALSRQLACPVIPLVSSKGEGLGELKQQIDQLARLLAQAKQFSPANLASSQLAPMAAIVYPDHVEQAANHISQLLPELPALSANNATARAFAQQWQRWVALQILEGDVFCAQQMVNPAAPLADYLQQLPVDVQQDAALLIADSRYQRVAVLCDTVSNVSQTQPHRLTQQVDKLALHRWWGVPFFFLVMYVMFLLSINLGGALQPIFDVGSSTIFIDGIQWLGAQWQLPQWLTVFLAQGIGGGINTVLPLVPQIGLMFLFLSFLEDVGYMARAAFVMDRMMQWLGLPGKSFVPLIVGFGCNVPSVMGARTLEAPRERLITIMMAPFMSCGARLAIFAVFASAFFGQHGASIVFSLYLLGIAVAILTGLLLKHTLMRGEATPFVMEIPLYHTPHWRSLLLQSWQRLKGFVVRAGRVIIIASIIIGGLNSFTLQGKVADSMNQSALAQVSKLVTPVLAPLGVQQDNWQATVGLVTGAMAKEVVVGTLNTLYTAEDLQKTPFDVAGFNFWGQMADALSQTWQGLKDTFSLAVLSNPIEASKGDGDMSSGAMGVMSAKFGSAIAAYSYLIFVLLYVPCASVMGAIAREVGRNWMSFSILWGVNAAYSLSTLFYQVATFQQHPHSALWTILTVIGVNILIIVGLLKMKMPDLLAGLEPNLNNRCHKKCGESACH